MLAACLVLCVSSAQSAISSNDADFVLVDPVPSRQLLADSEVVEGSGGDYGYGFGYYQETEPYSGRRHLMSTEGVEGERGYGYYGYYQAATPYPRRLSEVDTDLEPSDPLLQQQEQQQQVEVAPAAVVAAAVKAARTGSKEVAVPVGKCYCQFDPDFNTFAIGEERCKDALYQKCKMSTNTLECAWLDAYYHAGMKPGFLGHVLPHEADIKAFLFEDCTPAPPCACKSLKFDGSDDEAAAIACCRDMKTSCKASFSGIACKTVEQYCHDEEVVAGKAVAAWAKHAVKHAVCSAYNGLLFEFMSLKDIESAHQASIAPATEEKLISSPDQLLQILSHDKQQEPAPAAAAAVSSIIISSSATLKAAASSMASNGSGSALLIILGAGLIATATVGAVMAVVSHMGGRSSDMAGPLLPPPNSAVAAMSRSASMMSTGSGMTEPLLPSRTSRSNLRGVASSGQLISNSGTPRAAATCTGPAPSRNSSWASLADSTH